MSNTLHVKLVTPDRTLLELEVASISLPTPDGEITVLPHHAPIATLLVAGIVHLKTEPGAHEQDEIAVSGGFVHIDADGTVKILADTAERGEELDIDVLEEAKKRAQEVMSNAAKQDDVSYAAAAAALERELARYRLANKRRFAAGGRPTIQS